MMPLLGAGGGGAGPVTVTSMTVFSQGAAGGTSSGSITLNNDGTISHGGSGSVQAGHYVGSTSWCSPQTTAEAATLDFICDSASSSVPGTSVGDPSIGSWISMTSAVSFSLANTGNQSPDRTWDCRIRDHASGVVLASFTVTINLENT